VVYKLVSLVWLVSSLAVVSVSVSVSGMAVVSVFVWYGWSLAGMAGLWLVR